MVSRKGKLNELKVAELRRELEDGMKILLESNLYYVNDCVQCWKKQVSNQKSSCLRLPVAWIAFSRKFSKNGRKFSRIKARYSRKFSRIKAIFSKILEKWKKILESSRNFEQKLKESSLTTRPAGTCSRIFKKFKE